MSSEQRKAALSRLVTSFADANVAKAWSKSPSIRTQTLFYALSNPLRPNVPSVEQLREVEAFARKLAADIIACADGIDAVCADLPHTFADSDALQACEESDAPALPSPHILS